MSVRLCMFAFITLFFSTLVHITEAIDYGFSKWILIRDSDLDQSVWGSSVKDRGQRLTSYSSLSDLLTQSIPSESLIMNATVPGTVLSNLLQNNSFSSLLSDSQNPFCDEELKKLPDISDIGSDFYTFWYIGETGEHANTVQSTTTQTFINIHGINYKGIYAVNGHSGSNSFSPGMFHRENIDVTNVWREKIPNLFGALIFPPDDVGKPIKACKPKNCGQGGDHGIAKNGAIMQYTLGWDWITSTPDRNTGLWDSIEIQQINTMPTVIIPSSASIQLQKKKRIKDGDDVVVDIDIPIKIKNIDEVSMIKEKKNLTISLSMKGSHKKETFTKTKASLFHLIQKHKNSDGMIDAIPTKYIQQNNSKSSSPPTSTVSITISLSLSLQNISLWWPIGMGKGKKPFLYDLSFSITDDNNTSYHTHSQVVGLRTVELVYNNETQGNMFLINNVKFYATGGNWIGTDMFLRDGNSFHEFQHRYESEIGFHKAMGMNMIRVWGGGIAERSIFYDLCDKAGIVVWQEFWMTGDNNGRWAGDYDWPLDHSSYLSNAQDTILRLRHHPSLIVWVGGNELDPLTQSPPPDINSGLLHFLKTLDPDRPYIESSMTNHSHFDPKHSMAPKDGPYGLLDNFQFAERNPGMMFWNNSEIMRGDKLPVSFHVELGSVTCPVYESLQRFLSSDSLMNFPKLNKENKHASAWDFHNFMAFKTSPNGDSPMYALGNVTNVQTYSEFAQIILKMQHQYLFEGFQEYLWVYYTGVLLWKSQSPWPALRGALYDSYLAPTGGFYGVQTALADTINDLNIHIQLNMKTRDIVIVNKGQENVDNLIVNVQTFSLVSGKCLSTQSYPSLSVPASSVLRGDSIGHLVWPSSSSSSLEQSSSDKVILVRLSLKQQQEEAKESTVLSGNEYLVPQDPLSGYMDDFSSIIPTLSNTSSVLDVYFKQIMSDSNKIGEIKISNTGKSIAVGVAVSLADTKKRRNRVNYRETQSSECLSIKEDDRILTTEQGRGIYLSDNYFSLLPGETKVLSVLYTTIDDSDSDKVTGEITVVAKAINSLSVTSNDKTYTIAFE